MKPSTSYQFLLSILLPTLLAADQRVLPADAKRPPSFVFILVDDFGWSWLSAPMDPRRPDSKSDYHQTPNVDRLAVEGMRFTSGYAPAPICTPARRSIQFGMTPARQRGTEFKSTFEPRGKLSIPLALKQADVRYVAAHFGKWGEEMGASPEDVGYDESDGQTGNATGGFGETNNRWKDVVLNNDPKRTFEVTRRSVGFMERQVRAGRPFYLQVSYYATHADFQARAETLAKYEHRPKGKVHDVAVLAAMTEDVDAGIGEVLAKVDALGIRDETYIIFMADNGAVPWVPPDFNALRTPPSAAAKPGRNSPLRAGKWTVFEGGVRVPFIVRGPRVKAAAVSDVPVTGWDLLPTLRDLAGRKGELPPDVDGGSFRAVMEDGGAGTIRRSFVGLVFHSPFMNAHSAIRVGDYKLVKLWDTEQLLLFNLRDDLGETHDLAAAQPKRRDELHRLLMRYLADVRAEEFGASR